MSERKVAGFCEDNCKFEVYTKEEIISLFEYVIANNALPEGIINGGSVTSALAAVNAIVEQNKGAALKFFVGTQTEWDAYTGDKTNMHPFLSDDATIRNLTNRVTTLEQNVESLDKTVNDICAGTVGDITISHKQLLWTGEYWSNKSENGMPITASFTSAESLKVGDIIEIEWSNNIETNMGLHKFAKFRLGSELYNDVNLIDQTVVHDYTVSEQHSVQLMEWRVTIYQSYFMQYSLETYDVRNGTFAASFDSAGKYVGCIYNIWKVTE